MVVVAIVVVVEQYHPTRRIRQRSRLRQRCLGDERQVSPRSDAKDTYPVEKNCHLYDADMSFSDQAYMKVSARMHEAVQEPNKKNGDM